MPLPDTFLQELKARSDLAEIAASYVNLKRSGRNLVGLCPFHSEKTPSFNIYPEEGNFYCFGCEAGGDVITFIRRIENLDYMEAVRFLAQRAGMQVPENNMDDGMSKLRTRILEMNRESARFYYTVLNSDLGKDGRDYFAKRALSPATVRHFGLGFSPASRVSLVSYLEKKGFSQNDMILANVAVKGRSGQAVDRFFGRVMFPIIDLRGNVIAFGGRTLGDDKPKYLNTSETPVFSKGNTLFALNFAKNARSGRLILCEGYMDVIAMHQAGFTEAVATLGTALTPPQARLMARYAKEVVVCYDADEPGQKAASRAIPILREAGLLVKVFSVTDGKDPDGYIKEHGALKFKQLLDACGNDVEYRIGKIRAGCNMQSAEGRVAFLNEAAKLLATLDNRVEQEVYAAKLASEIGVETSAVMLQVDRYARQNNKKRQRKEFQVIQRKSAGINDSVNPEKSRNLRAAAAEEALIAYLLKYPENAKEINVFIPPEKFITDFNRRVYTIIMGRIMEGKTADLTGISKNFSLDEISYLSHILAKYNTISPTIEDAAEYAGVIQQENDKIRFGTAVSETSQNGDIGDIREYLRKLRQQKK